jgi:hypothetical protein
MSTPQRIPLISEYQSVRGKPLGRVSSENGPPAPGSQGPAARFSGFGSVLSGPPLFSASLVVLALMWLVRHHSLPIGLAACSRHPLLLALLLLLPRHLLGRFLRRLLRLFSHLHSVLSGGLIFA